MSVEQNQRHLKRITSIVLQGDAVLFLGAGASKVSGLPDSSELVFAIKTAFPEGKFTSDNFIEVCQAVLDCEVYDRGKLEDLVRSKIENFDPSEAHYQLTRHNWAAIFTTNYDDLIEQAFRTSPFGRKPVYVVTTDHFQRQRNVMEIYKLMGTLNARGDDPGRMVLSRSDYLMSIARRAKWYEYLRDFARSGTIIFIGYRGDDSLAFDVLDEIIQTDGIQNVPASYALYPKVDWATIDRYKFSRRKIIPVECDFESFFKVLSESSSGAPTPVERQLVLRVWDRNVTFPQKDIGPLISSFTPLDESIHSTPQGDMKEFFRGVNASWGAFRLGWDFQRDVYAGPKGILNRVRAELAKTRVQENRVLLVTGIPGIGKSVMLRRLAYDVYTQGAPVLIFSSTKNTFDQKILDEFLRTISRNIRQQGEERPPKALIIFDDAPSLMFDPSDVASFLASRGRPALVVAAAREETWPTSEIDLPVKVPESDIFSMPQRLSNEEKESFVKHLVTLGFIPDTEFWDDLIQREMQDSFFAAMYRLVDPSRRPLGQIIRDQFLKLDDVGKKLFLQVSSFHRFGLPMNIELLVRSCLNNNYETFQKALEKRAMRELISEDEDWEGNVLYSTHNRIIAQKTFDFFVADRTRQRELYEQIMSFVHLSLPKERELVERLLIRNLGPNRNLSDFSFEERERIFQVACVKEPTRALLHHLGILQTKAAEFEEAERTLNNALSLRERYVEALRGESRQNILTSLGNLYLSWAEHSESTGDFSWAEKMYAKAETYLGDAIQSGYPKPHPYHVMARIS